MTSWTNAQAAARIAVPSAGDDKYRRGVLGAVTGSERFPGAAVLGVEAAHRMGVGMVRLVAPRRVEDLVLARRPETVLGTGRVQAWLLGSGQDASARSPQTRAALLEALHSGEPVVLDAGALDLAREARGPAVLTPHRGELERLLAELGGPRDRVAIDADPAAAAIDAARRAEAVVVLKGSQTIVATAEGRTLEPPTGTAWLATAGTGDVLGGILGALVATHAERLGDDASMLAELAATAVLVHGEAARRAAERGPIAALDVADAVPAAVAALLAERR